MSEKKTHISISMCIECFVKVFFHAHAQDKMQSKKQHEHKRHDAKKYNQRIIYLLSTILYRTKLYAIYTYTM